MNTTDRRGLNHGVALLALGTYFLLSRQLHFRGPGPLLLLIGTILFTIAALRDFRGPIVPAGVLLGLGTAFLLREPLERWMPGWATLLLGIGSGLIFSGSILRWIRHDSRPGPLVPGIVLVTIALVTALSETLSIPEAFFEAAWRLWPFALVAAGAMLVLRAVGTRKSS